MTTHIYSRVASWHCDGLPAPGLSEQDRKEVIESAQGSYLSEHVDLEESELLVLDDKSLVAIHYYAMVNASR